MIDSHCHLADAQFTDLPDVLKRAAEAGVDRCITIADNLPEALKCVEIAAEYPNVYCTVGVHPHAASTWNSENEQKLRALTASSAKVKAIGEIGLDYHYDHSPRDVQREVFRAQLALAHDVQLPVVVHCREAIADVSSIVMELKPKRLVLHCCTEQWSDVAPLVAEGYVLSFTGIITYAKSESIRDTVRRCPLEQLMIETDSPYLAPIPHRGKRNEPAYVAEVAKAVAEIKGISLEEVDRVTTKNTVAFFGFE
jgi:TatD DNase family protein